MADTFREGFEIVIGAHDDEEIYDYEKGEYRPQYLEEIANVLSELDIPKDQIEHDGADIGVGASADAIWLLINGLTLFLSGKKIEENIDAWIKLAKRLKGVLKKLKKRNGGEETGLYISEPFALALALGDIIESRPKAKHIELEDSHIKEVPNPSLFAEFHGIFKYDHMRYYIFTFKVLDEWEEVHLICMRSTGDIEFHHILHVGNWMRFSGVEMPDDDA